MPTDARPPARSASTTGAAPDAYLVVMDAEEAYSIWPDELDLPQGWRPAGFGGSREACLAHIESVWNDMRPLSLRRAMADER